MRKCLWLFLVTASVVEAAATSAFQLGINYTEWLSASPTYGLKLATDNLGAVYLLTGTLVSNGVTRSTVTKLSPDGKTVLWQNQLGFAVTAMAVDPDGGVYVVPLRPESDTTAYVAKLNPGGIGLAWKVAVGFLPIPSSPGVIAADSQGRVYFTARYVIDARAAYLVRINASGSGLDFTIPINGEPSSIALDPAGAAYIAGDAVDPITGDFGFLTKISADGAPAYYAPLSLSFPQTLAVDSKGNVTLFASNLVQRLDPTGAVVLKTPVIGYPIGFALDAAGNAYVEVEAGQLYPVKNSLGTCPQSSELLTVIAPDGSVLQTTYIPGGIPAGADFVTPLAVTPNGNVFIAAYARPGFTPTQTGPIASGSVFLSSLSPTAANSSATTYPLVCAGNSASLSSGSISPGELITLYGQGLGPQQGVQPQPDSYNRYPAKAANVQVTLDGIAAPLLWVQASQINLITPWSLIPGKNTELCVLYNNVKTNCLTLPVVQATPAVFTLNGLDAVALNQDGTLNSATNPAAPNSIVAVWATGLGLIAPSQPDGSVLGLPLPANTLIPTVEAISVNAPFGGLVNTPFEVKYAGSAPTFVAGVSQINFRLAPFTPSGAIYLNVGSAQSPGFLIHVAAK